MAGVVTSVRIDMELYVWAHESGLNVSNVLNQSLRSLKGDGDMTEGQVASLLDERQKKLGNTIRKSVEAHVDRKFAALSALQSKWNLYLSSGDKPEEAKYKWIDAHRGRSEALQGMTTAEIMAELEGTK